MSYYLMKYKGTYRVLPELDLKTHDIPRDRNGEIAEGYDDLYVSCQHGNKIYHYGHMNGNTRVTYLGAYIPSIGRGRNIKKQVDGFGIEVFNYEETDSEVIFLFKAKDIESIAKLMKAKTAGANISPFSNKNLPKSDVQIPSEEIARYKETIAQISKDDILTIHHITNKFLTNIIEKNIRKNDKKFNCRVDMKTMCMSRQVKEYIYIKGYWNDFLIYLDKEIKALSK